MSTLYVFSPAIIIVIIMTRTVSLNRKPSKPLTNNQQRLYPTTSP
jgi:hypothetical protein